MDAGNFYGEKRPDAGAGAHNADVESSCSAAVDGLVLLYERFYVLLLRKCLDLWNSLHHGLMSQDPDRVREEEEQRELWGHIVWGVAGVPGSAGRNGRERSGTWEQLEIFQIGAGIWNSDLDRETPRYRREVEEEAILDCNTSCLLVTSTV